MRLIGYVIQCGHGKSCTCNDQGREVKRKLKKSAKRKEMRAALKDQED